MNVILLVVLCTINAFQAGDYGKCSVVYGGSFETVESCQAAAVEALTIEGHIDGTVIKAGCLREVDL